MGRRRMWSLYASGNRGSLSVLRLEPAPLPLLEPQAELEAESKPVPALPPDEPRAATALDFFGCAQGHSLRLPIPRSSILQRDTERLSPNCATESKGAKAFCC
jgi:hypothetical protein